MTPEFEHQFESDVVDLNNPDIRVPLGSLAEEVGLSEREAVAKSVTPDEIKPSDANIIDEKTQAEISLKLDPLPLAGFDKTALDLEDSKSLVDSLQTRYSPFSTYGDRQPTTKGASTDPLTLAYTDPEEIDLSKKAEEKLKDSMNDYDADPYFEPDIDALYDKAYGTAKDYAYQGIDYLKNLYGTYTPRSAPGINPLGQPMYGSTRLGLGHGISPAATSGASAPMGFAGTGYGSLQPTSAVQQAQQAVAALGPQAPQWANQATLGQISGGGYGGLTSSTAVGATRLATSGPGVNTLGQPMYGSSAAKSGPWGTLGTLLSAYSVYDSAQKGDLFGAGTSLMTLINPTTALPMAALHAVKFALGAWSASKRPKPAFGGAEFKASKNSLMATGGYGYNAYNKAAGQAMVASVADYVNSYTKHFNLQFNGTRWADAIADDPRMNRYDTMNESGYADPSVLSRKIFETQGLITGTPSVGGVPITSQEDYQAKVENFNKWYKETALERGGLVDAKRVGINQQLSNEWTKVPFAESKAATPSGGGQYTTRQVGGGRGGGGTTQTGYWKQSYHGQTWVPAPQNVSVEQTYHGSVATALREWEEDATPYDMIYKNLVGKFPRGRGGTYYG